MINSQQPSEIHIWPIERLVFYARNPRKNDTAVERMVASIREYGFKIPVLAQPTSSLEARCTDCGMGGSPKRFNSSRI